MPKTKQQLDISKGGFYEVEDTLYFVKDNGDTFELDFDIKHAIKNKIKNKSEMVDNSKRAGTTTREDITTQQVEENYWVETPKTKRDTSTAIMETRISKCMEATGKTREECSKEVKTRMKKDGSENTNTDIAEEEEVKEEDTAEEEEDTKDMTEICPKELDMLRKKAVEFDELIKERETEKEGVVKLKEDFSEAMEYVEKLKKERAEDLESQRQEEIKKLVNDFQIPTEEIENDTLEDLAKTRKRINLALNTSEVEDESIAEDMANVQSSFDKKVAELDAHYKVKW